MKTVYGYYGEPMTVEQYDKERLTNRFHSCGDCDFCQDWRTGVVEVSGGCAVMCLDCVAYMEFAAPGVI